MGPSFAPGVASLISGLFTDQSAPYGAGMQEYQKYLNQGIGAQQPFYQAGQNALSSLNDWLGGMKDPSKFINNLMSQYQASPYSQYLQQQAQRAGTNAASASGLIGSTPFAQQLQENAANIASGDMNQWLQSVLGVNTQYGQGQEYLSGLGANAANKMSDLYGNAANWMGTGAYGKELGNQQNTANLAGGTAGTILGLFGL